MLPVLGTGILQLESLDSRAGKRPYHEIQLCPALQLCCAPQLCHSSQLALGLACEQL